MKDTPFTQINIPQGLVEACEKVLKERNKGSKEAYRKVFAAALKKFGVKDPGELGDDAKKKEFFNYVDSQWNAATEKGEDGPKA